MSDLVLSLFPGIGLLDMAFELEGFCIVRGPDLLWGGCVKKFHPPAGKFAGVIGGPPCQRFSRLAALVKHVYGEDKLAENLIPEYERIVGLAQPDWFVMENVPKAPEPEVHAYSVTSQLVNNRHVPEEPDGFIGPEQNRVRIISFGVPGSDGRKLHLDWATFENQDYTPAVCASGTVWEGGYQSATMKGRPTSKANAASFPEWCRLQGLPEDFDIPPFKVADKIKAIGNGVPIPLGRAIARAVKEAIR